MKFEKLFEAKEHKLIDKNGNEIKITPDMAISVKWSEVEAAEEEYNEAFLAKLRDLLKTFESEEKYVFIEPVYDKNANPGQFTATMKHTSRRIKDCLSVIGFAIPNEIAEDKVVVDDFIEKISEKHPHYVYFSKINCGENIILY